MARKTDYESIAASYDRRYQDNQYPGTDATLRAFVDAGQHVLEVGCGTGHWLERMESWGCRVSGVDPAAAMLEKAAARGLCAEIVRGAAEELPWPDATFDRVVCINAVHHFSDKLRFAHEARRVLRAGGRVLSIALDPSSGLDTWCIYDYFAPTLELDRARFPATSALRGWLSNAGFVACESVVVDHLKVDLPARETLEQGKVNPASTSQLAILSAEELEAGIARIWADVHSAEARGEALRLTGDLRLWATFGSVA
jgi:ubiquinone/menaquinone biosynthesis C-methylase UbiE